MPGVEKCKSSRAQQRQRQRHGQAANREENKLGDGVYLNAFLSCALVPRLIEWSSFIPCHFPAL